MFVCQPGLPLADRRPILSLDISEALAIRLMKTFSWEIIRENIVDRSMT
jgi:hypothetical protein